MLERKEAYYRNDRTSSAFSTEASDVFQTFLENIPALQQQSLQSHLLEQLFIHKLDPLTLSFAERIIGNLTNDGFHVVPLNELFKEELSKNKGEKSIAFTRHKICHVLSIIRQLDPIGCATQDFKQALLVQAKILFHKKTKIDPVYAYTIDIFSKSNTFVSTGIPSTREGVKDCIKEILIEQSAKGSKISDQQISALLQEKYGVSIARRTVAKYRKELDIRSSYNRM